MADASARSRALRTAVAAAALLLPAAPARAHKLLIFAEARGPTLTGEAYFAGGGKVRDAEIRVLDPQGRELGRTRTDSQGRFAFEARSRCDHRLVLESGDGHRAEYVIEAAELPPDLPSGPAAASRPAPTADAPTGTAPAAGAEGDLRSLVALAVRKELERHRQEIRVRDVIAGVGYIFGVMGLVLYLKCRRRRDREA
jgi:nickel transport protein